MCGIASSFKIKTFHIGRKLVKTQDIRKEIKQQDVLREGRTVHHAGGLLKLRQEVPETEQTYYATPLQA